MKYFVVATSGFCFVGFLVNGQIPQALVILAATVMILQALGNGK